MGSSEINMNRTDRSVYKERDAHPPALFKTESFSKRAYRAREAGARPRGVPLLVCFSLHSFVLEYLDAAASSYSTLPSVFSDRRMTHGGENHSEKLGRREYLHSH